MGRERSRSVSNGRQGTASGFGVRARPGRSARPGGRRLYNWAQRTLFDAASRLTGRWPRAGAPFLDAAIGPVAGSRWLAAMLARRNRRIMLSLRSFRRFLAVPDTHIGDAVMSQTALAAIRDFFPEAMVDYVVNKTAFPLIEGNSEATRTLPFFSNGSFPSAADLAALRQLIRDERYDLVFNFCPYITGRDIGGPGTGFVDIMSHAPAIVRNEGRPAVINHFAYQTYGFTADLLSLVAPRARPAAFPGIQVRVGDAAVEDARRFAAETRLPAGTPIIMLNPDAASPFTRVPDRALAGLLSLIVRLDGAVLVGAGHTEAGISERMLATLPPALRSKARLVPASLSLEAYTALVDLCDVFVTADTGPMHLAAARRLSMSGRHEFRNRTAVLSIFGATPARMSGYDSLQPGFLPADQAAPSWAYRAGSPCRNITCINKIYKTCRNIRCFDGIDVAALADRIREYLQGLG
jgi:ADP-heptose:LPS heptosyltransferase